MWHSVLDIRVSQSHDVTTTSQTDRCRYSLYQSHTTGPFIGDLSLAALHNVLAQPSLANTDIPDILYACFGFTFVTATAMILSGAMLERGRLFPSMLFLLCWTTFVYYVLAYFEWNPSGWLYQLGVYDFAGSGPVHIASGFSALAWALMLGPRKDPHKESLHHKVPQFRPHNPFLVGLGTILIWFGWFAFNGASTANRKCFAFCICSTLDGEGSSELEYLCCCL